MQKKHTTQKKRAAPRRAQKRTTSRARSRRAK